MARTERHFTAPSPNGETVVLMLNRKTHKGKFESGWDKLREEIFARQTELKVMPSHVELTKRPEEIPAWDRVRCDFV
jgi:hypothetical protein